MDKNLYKEHDDIRTNTPCCHILLGCCFLQVNRQKRVRMVPTNNVEKKTLTRLKTSVETIPQVPNTF